jgi:hypothetical protein
MMMLASTLFYCNENKPFEQIAAKNNSSLRWYSNISIVTHYIKKMRKEYEFNRFLVSLFVLCIWEQMSSAFAQGTINHISEQTYGTKYLFLIWLIIMLSIWKVSFAGELVSWIGA